MENLVKKELVRVLSNNPYGFNRDLWREHKEKFLRQLIDKLNKLEGEK